MPPATATRPRQGRELSPLRQQNIPAVFQALGNFDHRIGSLILVLDVRGKSVLLFLQQKEHIFDRRLTFAPPNIRSAPATCRILITILDVEIRYPLVMLFDK